jgi:hypothetical protein
MFLFAALPTRDARATDDAAFVEYDASDGCPSQAEFIEQVRARTPRARFVSESKGARIFSVSVSARAHDAAGRLSTRRSGEKGAPREVVGKTCAEVVSALALVAALAIDPHASTAPAVSTSPSVAPAPAVPEAPPAPSTPADTAPAPTAEKPLSPPPAAEGSDELSRAGRAGATSPRQGGFVGALRGGVSRWEASEPVVFASIGAAIEYETGAPSFWSPALRISGARGESLTVRPASGAARFTRTTGALDLCPVRWAAFSGLALRPCAGFEAGELDAHGIAEGSITHPGSSSLAWVAVRETVRLLGDLGRGWALEIEGGVSEPLRRDTFVFSTPDVAITRVPAVEPLVAVGVGAHFL